MRILIVNNTRIPVAKYGGTERVIWHLGRELRALGHEVHYLVRAGSHCPFARVYPYDPQKPMASQIPPGIDVMHLQFPPGEPVPLPCVVTLHSGSTTTTQVMHENTVFLSEDHARRHGSTCWIYNGLDWNDYEIPDLRSRTRRHFHFLGKARNPTKNVEGAIRVAKRIPAPLTVLGGGRLGLSALGLRLTLDPDVRFEGMVGNSEKAICINDSRGLLFPVLWHEPFGLAVIESFFFGCPVFATPYGSLPELVTADVGALADDVSQLAAAASDGCAFDRVRCHEYARDTFNARRMTLGYLDKYETVLNGHKLNPGPLFRLENPPRFLPFHW